MIDIFFGLSATEWAEIIRNYTLTIVALFSAWVAWQSLASWKEQKSWEANHNLAKEFLRICIEMQSKAYGLRISAMFPDNMENFHSRGNVTKDVDEVIYQTYHDSIQSRLNDFEKTLVKFQAKGEEVSYSWSKTIDASLSDTAILLSELKLAATARGYLARFPKSESKNLDEYIKLSDARALIIKPGGDHFSDLLDKRFSILIDHILPYLKQQS